MPQSNKVVSVDYERDSAVAAVSPDRFDELLARLGPNHRMRGGKAHERFTPAVFRTDDTQWLFDELGINNNMERIYLVDAVHLAEFRLWYEGPPMSR